MITSTITPSTEDILNYIENIYTAVHIDNNLSRASIVRTAYLKACEEQNEYENSAQLPTLVFADFQNDSSIGYGTVLRTSNINDLITAIEADGTVLPMWKLVAMKIVVAIKVASSYPAMAPTASEHILRFSQVDIGFSEGEESFLDEIAVAKLIELSVDESFIDLVNEV